VGNVIPACSTTKNNKQWFISGSDDLEGNHRLSVFDDVGKSIVNSEKIKMVD